MSGIADIQRQGWMMAGSRQGGLFTHRLCRSQMFSRLVETGNEQAAQGGQGRYPQFSAEETGRSVSLNVSL